MFLFAVKAPLPESLLLLNIARAVNRVFGLDLNDRLVTAFFSDVSQQRAFQWARAPGDLLKNQVL